NRRGVQAVEISSDHADGERKARRVARKDTQNRAKLKNTPKRRRKGAGKGREKKALGNGWRSRRAIDWIEHYCVIPEGKYVGQPVRLTEHQKAWLASIYDSPTRLLILSIPRKNAKTAFSAFLLLLHL